jgi:hypothetical protein
MPPRYTYWTIILDGQPTAFRAADRETLLPTLKQLQSKNPDAVMKWFARGKVWNTPEEAGSQPRGAGRGSSAGISRDVPPVGRPSGPPEAGDPPADRRGKAWRPGGEHKDPREKFKKETFQARKRREKKAASLAREARHGSATGAWPKRPWEDRGKSEGQSSPREGGASGPPQRPWDNRGPRPEGASSNRRPWENRGPKPPGGPNRPWENRGPKPPGGAAPKRDWNAGAKAGGGPKRPWENRGPKPPGASNRPWEDRGPRPEGAKRPWENRGARDDAPPKRRWNDGAKGKPSSRPGDGPFRKPQRDNVVNREDPSRERPPEMPRPVVTEPTRPPEPERLPSPHEERPSRPAPPSESIRIPPSPPEQGTPPGDSGGPAPAHKTKMPRLRQR